MTVDLVHTSKSARRSVLAVATAACLAIGLGLTGCSINPIESLVEGVTGGNVDIGGTSIPEDFPAEVPLIDGEVIGAFGVGSGADKVFTVTIKVADASALDEIKAQLEGAGFTTEFDRGIGGLSGAAYKNADYGVLVVVAEDGKTGWVANYTVTPAGK